MSLEYCNYNEDGEMTSCFNSTYDNYFYTFFGWSGCAAALVFANCGTAFGTSKSGMGIASMSVTRPHLAFKSLIPIIMAGILSIYGLIIAILLSTSVTITDESYGPYKGFK